MKSDSLRWGEAIINPGCTTCDGSGATGDPAACSDSIPLCMGAAVCGPRGCTCESGFMARAEVYEDGRRDRLLVSLLQEADERLRLYEETIRALAEGSQFTAGIAIAEDCLSQSARALQLRQELTDRTYGRSGERGCGVCVGYRMGVADAVRIFQARLRQTRRQHEAETGISRSEVTVSGGLRGRIGEQLPLFAAWEMP